jgi:hypothetical protein
MGGVMGIMFETVPLKISVFRDYPKILKQLEFELKLLGQEWTIADEKSTIEFSAGSIASPLNPRRIWVIRFIHKSPKMQDIPKTLQCFCFHAKVDLWGIAKEEFLRENNVYVEFYENDIILFEEGLEK